jgi:hypothetical protein
VWRRESGWKGDDDLCRGCGAEHAGYAAAFFLVVAIGLVIALIRLAQTLNRVDKLVEDTTERWCRC